VYEKQFKESNTNGIPQFLKRQVLGRKIREIKDASLGAVHSSNATPYQSILKKNRYPITVP